MGATTHRLAWVEWIKAIALILVFLNHIAERLFGYPFIANPTHFWPSFAERVAQLAPYTDIGLGIIPVNVLRYVGWLGDQGVQLFLIISGFGLTYGLLQKNEPVFSITSSITSFYRRRLARIYPQWLVVHVLFIVIWLVTGWGLSLFAPATYFSIVGLRIVPGAFYYFVAAWWYFWLLVQLYLVFPFLFRLLQRLGPGPFLSTATSTHGYHHLHVD